MSGTSSARLTRNTGLAIFWTAIAGAFLLLGFFAAVDPNTPPSGDPAWMGLVLLIFVMGFVARAWRVGIEVSQDQVLRHGWLRNSVLERTRISGVGSTNYSGVLFLDTSLLAMVVLRLTDGSEVELPELMGRHDPVWRLVDQLQAKLGVEPSGSRRRIH